MDFEQAIKSFSLDEAISTVKHCFSNALEFSGRAARSEFWYFFAFYVAAVVLASIIGSLVFSYLSTIVTLALLLPTVAVSVRRLQDLDRPALWVLLGLVPFAGLVLLYWFTQRGTVGPNQFGPDPVPAALGNAGLAKA